MNKTISELDERMKINISLNEEASRWGNFDTSIIFWFNYYKKNKTMLF